MKLNKKGFSLIELLAVIIILGIISGVAIGGTSIYMNKTRDKAYESMEVTLYNAASNYIIDKGVLVPECTPSGAALTNCTNGMVITSQKLIETGFLKELEDPGTNNSQCTGQVKVTRRKNTGKKLDEYNYAVHLECSTYANDRNFAG